MRTATFGNVWSFYRFQKQLKLSYWMPLFRPSSACNNRVIVIDRENTETYLRKLKHHDWLSPADTLKLLKPLKDPCTILTIINLARQRSDYVPSDDVFMEVFQKLGDAGEYDKIFQIFDLMRKDMCRLSEVIFRKLMKNAVDKTGDLMTAYKIFRAMIDLKQIPAIETFNIILNRLVRHGEYDKVYNLYLEAPKIHVYPNVCTFNILIEAVCGLGKFALAYSLLSEMKMQGFVPDAITYGTILNHLCKKGKLQEAVTIFEEMIENGCEANHIIYRIMFTAARERNNLKVAQKLWEKMESQFQKPYKFAYYTIIHCLLHNRMYQEAVDIIHEMLDRKFTPSAKCYTMLITGLCDEKELDDACYVLDLSWDAGYIPKKYSWKLLLEAAFMNNSDTDAIGKLMAIFEDANMIPLNIYS